MKKKFALLLVSVLIIAACVFSLAACDKEEEEDLFEKYRRRFSPCCSVASLYLWAVAGGAMEELTDPAAKFQTKKGASRKNGARDRIV